MTITRERLELGIALASLLERNWADSSPMHVIMDAAKEYLTLIYAKTAPTTDGFIQGYATALANAARLEDWRPNHNTGGFSMQSFKDAGVDEYDLKELEKHID
ncbi:hypothetical protein [Dyadobacter bucti]|uniref:hypothetical protein n=1 Tax=Dyadobacter bucti TaxID=2572203 RepID=UPI0011098B39|nr:hypothetical protein [Dyadobacter bucti]